jgi:hypothetical protein
MAELETPRIYSPLVGVGDDEDGESEEVDKMMAVMVLVVERGSGQNGAKTEGQPWGKATPADGEKGGGKAGTRLHWRPGDHPTQPRDRLSDRPNNQNSLTAP